MRISIKSFEDHPVEKPDTPHGGKRMLIVAILITIILALFVVSAGCTHLPEAPRDELVDIGTHRLYIHCTGRGRPTVVIDTGVGESYQSWDAMIDSFSQETRVCAYDRAGYGRSEPGPMPRDSQRAANELHLLLAKSGEKGPYILVGHSLGALNMQVYAHSYPGDVEGMVLLDPTPLAWMMGEGFPEARELFIEETQALRADTDTMSRSSDPEVSAKAAYLNAVASEFESFFGRTAEKVAEIDSFGEMPLTVIGATEPNPAFGEFAGEFRQFWNDQSQILAGKSESGKFILASGSSHHIHLDAPQVVMDAVRGLIP